MRVRRWGMGIVCFGEFFDDFSFLYGSFLGVNE